MNVLDLFSGPGGWDVAARELGLDPLGIEWDDAACKTREAAGLRTVQADVSKLDPADFGPVDMLIASPPCQDFSLAGKRAGIDGDRGKLVREVLRWVNVLRPTWIACEQVPPVLEIWQHFAHIFRSDWGYSAWTGVLNAADYGVPQTRQRAILIARCDGLPAHPPEPTHCRGGAPESMFGPGLEPWVSMAQALGWGMSERPSITLTAGGSRQGGPDPLDGGSGARATLRRERDAGRWEVHRGYGEGMTERYGERPGRGSDEPSFVVDSKARSWTVRTGNNSMVTGRTGSRAGDGDVQPYERSCEEPAPTLDTNVGSKWTLRNGSQQHATERTVHEPAPTLVSSMDNGDTKWVYSRPSTTVQGDPRIGRPGHKDRDKGEAQFEQESVRVTIEEAAALQSFPVGYPWQGSRTKQFEQIGNAVPPLLARHILAALVGDASEAAA